MRVVLVDLALMARRSRRHRVVEDVERRAEGHVLLRQRDQIGEQIAHWMLDRIVDDLRQPFIGDRRRRLGIPERDAVDDVDLVRAVRGGREHHRLRGPDLRGRCGKSTPVAVHGQRQVVVRCTVDEPDRNLHAAGPDPPQKVGQIDSDLHAMAADDHALGNFRRARAVARTVPAHSSGLPASGWPAMESTTIRIGAAGAANAEPAGASPSVTSAAIEQSESREHREPPVKTDGAMFIAQAGA